MHLPFSLWPLSLSLQRPSMLLQKAGLYFLWLNNTPLCMSPRFLYPFILTWTLTLTYVGWSCMVNVKVGVSPPVYFSKINLAILVHLPLPYHRKFVISLYVPKILLAFYIGIVWHWWIFLGTVDIPIILHLSTYEHNMCPHFVRSFYIYICVIPHIVVSFYHSLRFLFFLL